MNRWFSAGRAASTWSVGAAMRNRRGAAAAEFALIIPVMATVLFGIVKFGVALNNNVALTDGVRASIRQFAIARSSTTPYSDAVARFNTSTPGLNQSTPQLTFSVNGTSCNSDTSCKTLLTAATTGQPATLLATYACDLTILGFNAAPGCTLSSQTTERVE